MKVRTGFVSNSSSSSFLVAFEKIPKTANELREMMFGDVTIVGSGIYSHKTIDVANIVFSDIQQQLGDDLEFSDEVMACLKCNADVELIMEHFYPDIDDTSELYYRYEDKMSHLCPNGQHEDYDDFKEKYPFHTLCTFEYDNNDYMGGGEMFANFPCGYESS